MKLHAMKETTLFQLIKFIYSYVFICICYLMFEVSPTLVFVCKKTFLYSNVELLKLDILALLVIFIIWKFTGKCFFNFIDKNADKIIIAGSIVLFFIQICISYNIYFLTGWDAGMAIIPAAENIAFGISVENFNNYFSIYPNNITIVWIFSLILKLSTKLGIIPSGDVLMPIIAVNCFVSSLTGLLTYKCVEKLINRQWAIFSWIVYLLLVGMSPWVVITYSDSLALFLPILIFFIYSRDLTGKNCLIRWFLIGIFGFLGYHIKPQVIIILIAIIIVELGKFIFSPNARKKEKYFIFGILIVSFFLSNGFYKMIYKQTGLDMNKEKALGMTHFAMMGLNDEGGGYYNADDVRYSCSFSTSSERRKGNIKVIKERLNSFGASGYKKFLLKKTLVNYGDGTFAWSMEGEFYKKTYPDKNKHISPLLKSLYYYDGNNYEQTSTFEQAVWIGVIASMLGLIFIRQDKMDNKAAVLMLSIIGLTMFVLLFEARARYLYIYAPIYICLGILGFERIVDTANKFLNMTRKLLLKVKFLK